MESFDSEKNPWGFIFSSLEKRKICCFEHKRGVPGKGKTENFGCFMAFPCSLNSPNRELKTKKASRFDWRRLSKNVPIGTLHIGSEADDASYCGTIVKQCFI